MQKKKAECPICKAQHTVQLATGKLVYTCPSCQRTVRVRPPQQLTPKKKAPPKAIEVKTPEEIAVQEVSAKWEEKAAEPKKKLSKSETKRLKAQTEADKEN